MLIKKVIGFMILALVLVLSLSRCNSFDPDSVQSNSSRVIGNESFG